MCKLKNNGWSNFTRSIKRSTLSFKSIQYFPRKPGLFVAEKSNIGVEGLGFNQNCTLLKLCYTLFSAHRRNVCLEEDIYKVLMWQAKSSTRLRGMLCFEALTCAFNRRCVNTERSSNEQHCRWLSIKMIFYHRIPSNTVYCEVPKSVDVTITDTNRITPIVRQCRLCLTAYFCHLLPEYLRWVRKGS